MTRVDRLDTARLVMRRFADRDREPFAALSADPEVMAHFPAPLRREECDALIDRIEVDFDRHGFGLWALEVRASGMFIGFTGLAVPSFAAPFTPAVEVGWRLARHAWGQGFATEAARRSLDCGFDDFAVEEIVSFTSVGNARSRAVMERLAMTRDEGDDFDHPRVEEGHPLRRQVLYRMNRERWHSRREEGRV